MNPSLDRTKLFIEVNLVQLCREVKQLEQYGELNSGLFRDAQKMIVEDGIPSSVSMSVVKNLICSSAIDHVLNGPY